MSHHTPRPWRLLTGEITDIHGNVIAEVVGGDGCRYLDVDQNRECLANAELIVRSPDMLEELKAAEATLRWAVRESQGRVKREIVGGWLHRAESIATIVAIAEGRLDPPKT